MGSRNIRPLHLKTERPSQEGPIIYAIKTSSIIKFYLTYQATAKLTLEFFNTTRRVNKALFARINWVRIGSNISDDNVIFNSVNNFLVLGGHC